jgi:hypothetical protein
MFLTMAGYNPPYVGAKKTFALNIFNDQPQQMTQLINMVRTAHPTNKTTVTGTP